MLLPCYRPWCEDIVSSGEASAELLPMTNVEPDLGGETSSMQSFIGSLWQRNHRRADRSQDGMDQRLLQAQHHGALWNIIQWAASELPTSRRNFECPPAELDGLGEVPKKENEYPPNATFETRYAKNDEPDEPNMMRKQPAGSTYRIARIEVVKK